MSASVAAGPVVGRGAELVRLEALATGLSEGRGGAVALVGEAGIGKTRLVRAVTAESARCGVTAVVGRCVPGGMVAYRPVREAVLSWSRAHTLPPDDAALSWLSGLRPALQAADGPEPVSPLFLAEAVLRLLGDPARPGLLVVEDLHWADPETLAVVEYLADHAPESAAGLVVTLRSGALDPADDLVRRLHARAAVTLLRLRPLDRDAAATWVQERLGPVSPTVVSLVHARSGGNPLLLGELLDELASAPADELEERAAAALPAGVRDSVRSKLATLPPPDRDLVQVAALVGLDDPSLLPVATGRGESEARGALAAAADLGLLEPDPAREGLLQFRHELVRDAVVATTPADLRVTCTRRALERVLPDDVGALQDEERVEQVVRLAGASGARDLASRAAVRGAVLAFDRWAFASAERWLSRARSHADTDAALVNEIDLVQLRVSATTGHGDVVRRVGRALLARLPDDDDESRLEVLLRLAQVAGDTGEVEEARQLLADAAPLLPVVDDPCSWTKHRLAAARTALAAGDPVLAGRLSGQARDLARREADQRDLECSSLVVLGQARWPDAGAAAQAWHEGLGLAAAHGMRLWQGRMAVWCARAAVGDLTGDDLLQQAHAAAREAGAPLLGARAGALEAELALLRWQPDAVRRHLADAHGLLGGLTPPRDLSAALAAVGDALDVVDGQGAGPAALALADLLAGRVPTPPDPGTTTLEGALHDLVRLDPDAPTGRGLVRDAIARVARAADAAERRRALGAALSTLAPAPWLRALLVLRVAPALLEDGPSDDLREVLREAIAVLDDLPGAAGAADLGRDLIRRAGAPYPRRPSSQAGVPDGLRRRGITAREWQVLALVGEGLTNRQIAGRLFLSPRTVEKHVERMLTKTGAGNRAALGALAASADVT